MSNKKQRKRELAESLNPYILTLDQALELSKMDSTKDEPTRQSAASKAVRAIHDRVCCRFTGPSNFDRLTYGERMVWDITYMHGEVLNGGFHQYLTNSTGERGEDVKMHLQSIGATDTLKLFQQLSKIFPGGMIPRDREQRCAVVEKSEDRASGNDLFDELDGCFYRQSERLDDLIVAYVRKHRGDFAEPLDEAVMKLKRKDRITAHYCGSAEPEWLARADAALEFLQEFAKTDPTAR